MNAVRVEPSLEALISSEPLVLLDFHARWCGPCRAMLPVLDALEAEMGGRLRILKIDVDDHTDLAVRMGVMGVPTFMLYQNGVERWRQPGVFTKESLRQMIEAVES
ncbi:MAG: thioredoxin family protein [Saprospiraceae bacterium]|nr:thioredoxin family protein [Saprospiraceae bacterium]